MLLLPTAVEPSPLWDTLQTLGDRFVLQSLKTSSFLTTISSILSSSPSTAKPFRILCRIGPLRLLQVATASSAEEIRANARWLEAEVLPQISLLQSASEVENCLRERLEEQLGPTAAEAHGGGDSPNGANADEKHRTANEAYHSHFERVTASEELIQYYPSAYEKATRQGWLYISSNFIAFYSLLMGVETKVLLELKDVEEILKQNSKAGMLADSITVVTRNKTKHFFTNLMRRDECYDLLRSLTKSAMAKMLQTTGNEDKVGAPPPLPTAENVELDARNQNFRTAFALPDDQSLVDATYANVQLPGGSPIHGRLFLSSGSFICFLSSTKHQLHFSTPLYCIKKVERLQLAAPTITLALWHGAIVTVQLLCEVRRAEAFCSQLRTLLEKVIPLMKMVKPFVKTLPSEELVSAGKVQSAAIGLGAKYGYVAPTAPQAGERLQIWTDHFKQYGRNLTLMRNATFTKLLRVGVVDPLRGEIWDVTSGAMFVRFGSPGYYASILEKNTQRTFSMEEIDKDVNRSLPEYPGYQVDEGLEALRRVLYSYSLHNPQLGYCQAMNLLVACLLVYLSEEQAFWVLDITVTRLLPQYYTRNMVGAVVDASVLDALVEKHLPMLHAHFAKLDTELSVYSLSWLLSIYVNCMPLKYAFRIFDGLFAEGSQFLFQIALAILKINGDALLKAEDDSEMMTIFKTYFASLGDLVSDIGAGPKPVPRFTQLLLTAYREFAVVTSASVMDLRNARQYRVAQVVGQYAKRARLRELEYTGRFTKPQLNAICDKFFDALYYADDKSHKSFINQEDFPLFVKSIAPSWGDVDPDHASQKKRSGETKHITGSDFIDRLFTVWLSDKTRRSLSLQDIISGLHGIIFSGDDGASPLFYNMFTSNGGLGKEQVIDLAESLLFLLRRDPDDTHLGSISSFMASAVESLITQDQLHDQALSLDEFQNLLKLQPFLWNYVTEGFSKSFRLEVAEKADFIQIAKGRFQLVMEGQSRWSSSSRPIIKPARTDSSDSLRAPDQLVMDQTDSLLVDVQGTSDGRDFF
ncbi:TBC-domain-containing protein [Gonapodya prolifera JEL478]|uniref:TBC-domain-containing protein n=1 Tax=Gonapodya prolifera (strain JEL478) TaxID=1344416 RepID=A0A139AEQ6_GONPJ|nr:TBC-domain-containing protein [Gonapodya prolifera JEL478]|eukprot:KXS14903.1 TBC-domain-containing protein [Gonapodya prolifera JEL478]